MLQVYLQWTFPVSRSILPQRTTSAKFGLEFGRSFCLHRGTTKGDLCDSFSPCDLSGELRLCSKRDYGYDVKIMTAEGAGTEGSERMQASYTKVLACHVAYSAMVATCLLLLFLHSPNVTILRISLIIAVLTLFLDVVFCIRADTVAKHLSKLAVAGHARAGPGFGLTFLSAFFLYFEERAASYASEPLPVPTPPTSESADFYSHARMLERARPVLPIHVESSTTTSPRSYRNERDIEKSLHAFSSSHPIQKPKPARPRVHRQATDGLPGSECPICLERKTALSELPCNHVFCTECTGKAVSLYDRCPLCNKKSKVQDVRRLSMSSFV